VIEITERSVVIRQRDGARVHVPNVKVLAKKVTVYSTETDRRSVIELKLAIDTDVEHVEHVARTSLGDLEEVTRFGWVHAVSLDGVVGVSIAFWQHSGLEAQPRAVDAAIRVLQRSFADAGIHPVSAVDVQIVDSELTLRRGD
jgi:small-conductance mechanosensitive channel